ncbi:TonB system transport protein ExbD [Halopseudomonas pelagia]|uniref:TonB system transport protein ExbD n=1 Tax=Halopseudomonas pelagia TaxID=553151 RepID=UPI00039D81A3|nr:TonB system transport protein ExbD [Halopseudomonas pelagia]|tara:strand:- start:171 stop:593 length:423 start_codon:yes stop_codon:yes gene_type:complete
MSFKLSGGDDGQLGENHEINVTPFIDVMLVLLIIFMVAAPLATVSVPVDLPASTAKPQPPAEDPLYLSVQADLSLTLGEEQQVNLADLPAALARTAPDIEQRIFLRADKGISYGDLTEVINALGDAGYLKVALVGLERAQ